MNRKLTLSILMSLLTLSASAQYRSQVWSPDNGDGTYTNPVINADYSDPDVCVGPSGEDYYMTASSFHCTPGLPILHSKDLVNWEIVGYALKNLYEGNPELLAHFSSKPQHGNGVWAPSIRYHGGQYYIYWGDPDFGVMMVKTKDGNPAGEWENPVCVIRGQGYIDTTPLWDDDGRCYLVNGWANSRSKFASVLTVREMSADGLRPIGQPVIVFDGNGTENRTCEGPKFYKRDGWYWIMCPAGGVPTGFQLAMRSKSPYGPYEHKIVLAQGKTSINGPHQGGWVHTKYGEDWFVHFQDKEAYGRVVHLNPVDWSSGWPVMGRKGEPVASYQKPKSSSDIIVNPVESDEFNEPTLGLQWQWHGNYDEKFGVPTAFGTFRIYTYKLSEGWKNFWEVPNMLLQKTPADEFTVTTKLRFTSKANGQMGGLIMMGLDYTSLMVRRAGNGFELVQLTCKAADKGQPQTENVIATLKPTAIDKTDYKPGIHEDIYLRLMVSDSKLHFAWSQDGKKYQDCGSEFQMKEGKWIGAKFGYVAVETDPKCDRGWIDADWIRVTACEQVQSNEIVAKGESPVRLSGSYSFTEGPAADAKGDVFFTDQPNNKIYHWNCKTGKITLFTDRSGRSNGMYFDSQGNLIACADMDNQLWAFDRKGHATILITDFGGKLLNGPNDVWISKNGGYYLTDPYFKRDYWTRNPERQQPVEGLYYLAPGSKQLTMLDSTLNQPNGIVGTPDGKYLYVAEAKADRILRYDIQPDGRLTNRQVFADMGSDGMTIDDRGNIYLTGDGVTVFDKNGNKIAHFPIPEDWTANVCFGGKERNILFITASKSVYALKMLVHGVK